MLFTLGQALLSLLSTGTPFSQQAVPRGQGVRLICTNKALLSSHLLKANTWGVISFLLGPISVSFSLSLSSLFDVRNLRTLSLTVLFVSEWNPHLRYRLLRLCDPTLEVLLMEARKYLKLVIIIQYTREKQMAAL